MGPLLLEVDPSPKAPASLCWAAEAALEEPEPEEMDGAASGFEGGESSSPMPASSC